MSEHNPFRPALVIGLITAGLLSFAAFILMLGWSRPEAKPGGTAPSVGATGFAGIIALSQDLLNARVAGDARGVDSDDLLVIPLHPRDDPSQLADLLRRRAGEATLLILPKWLEEPDPDRGGWVRVRGPLLAPAADRLMGGGFAVEPLSRDEGKPPWVEGTGLLEGLAISLPSFPQVIHGDRVEMLLGLPGEGALVAQLGEQPHYVVADPDLLNNHGIRERDAARTAVEMLARMRPDTDSAIVFDDGNALAPPLPRNLLRAMFEPPFLAMTLALLVAAFLAGLYGVSRFGPVRRPERAIAFGKAALVENSAALVRLAGREVRLGGAYADLVRDEAARAGAAPPHLQGEALEVYLDRFSKPGDPFFRQLAWDVREAPDRPTLLAAARALFAWKKDMIR
ncbi:MAG TPA: hypothetical protein VEZ41_04250 [Allosphingosinicella sp.]|nr:hypothetical protein [Allosphingosinicella sp.]